ncbi:MAG: hypothetical protein FVQ81_15000 [Candidatus Glassbacteria bacterium]|nr:hypothetical protein [Candidatus Glassbacteria bacterium]
MSSLKGLRLVCLVLVLAGTAVCTGCSAPERTAEIAAHADWKSRIRPDHPRIFFNSDQWRGIQQHALYREHDLLNEFDARCDSLLALDYLEPGDYGTDASRAAFSYRMGGGEEYLELARRLLETSIAWYHARYGRQQSVSWYSFSRVNAWAAFDWIFEDLDVEVRNAMGRSFIEATANVMPTGPYRGPREPFERENWSGPHSGFYGTRSLAWYAGLALYGEGIADSLAEAFLADGYEQYNELLAYRSAAAGDDGGSASAALNYALAAYPWAEFNFFHSYRSATGEDISREWPYVARLAGYIYWNRLPGGLHLGSGDDYHLTNRIRTGNLHLHLSQIEHFYAGLLPEYATVTRWLLARLNRERRSSFPWARFLLTGTGGENYESVELPPAMPLARHFNNMGQVFLRSGSEDDDTYALFTLGGALEQHKHFDHLHFAIYRQGFQALDTGSRPEPGIHLYNYYCRTIAHNSILIYMPGEEMPSYWGKRVGIPAEGELAVPPPNDGGQREILCSEPVAFESGEHYAYVAGDATTCYHPDKSELVTRQFVFLPPDFFIVFDRVVSASPSFDKTWLLHTATEPMIFGRTFRSGHDRGRLFCRTLLPADARLTKIGGPGRQFWSGGRNWPLPAGWRAPDTTALLGQWRVEVTPGGRRSGELFLHVIQVGDDELNYMADCELLEGTGYAGVKFEHEGREFRVTFGTEGDPGGHIRIVDGGNVVVDKPLAESVQPQQGLRGVSD